MRLGGCQLGACSLLACFACACTTSGSISPTADGAVVDVNQPPVPADDAGPAVDSAMPAVDATIPDAADAAVATDSSDASDAEAATGCAWDGSYESPACSTCLRAACCDTMATCEGDPQCVALDMCVDACLTSGGGDAGVAVCSQTCFDSHTLTVRNEWKALSDCVELDCSNNGAGPCQ